MITPEVIKEVQRLLMGGNLSQRKIAAKLGVSRGTVSSVANGTRPQREVRRRRGFLKFVPPSGLPRRCPLCGRLVQMPCLACHLRQLTTQRVEALRRFFEKSW